MRKTYSLETAKVLLELAYPEWGFPPYVIRDDGVYQSDGHREASPSEEAFDWSPAYDMSGPDAPDPMTAPMLPIPFSAADLAVFMLDGAGSMIPESLGCRIGDHAQNFELLAHPRRRKVREALQEAFALLDQAMQQNGLPNYEEQASAQRLLARYDKENGLANEREGVFGVGASEEERRTRRSRAVSSVAELKAAADKAEGEAKRNWKEWRKKMVRALLEDRSSVEISEDRCCALAGEQELYIDHWVELTGVGIGQHESYLVAKDRISFRDWEEDFIAAAPGEMQAEMLNDNRTAPKLAFPCRPEELVTFVDTAIGIHCFMVPDAFRAEVERLSRCEAETGTVEPENNQPNGDLPKPRIGWKKSVAAAWPSLLQTFGRKPTVEELVSELEENDQEGFIVPSGVGDELKWRPKKFKAGKSKTVSRDTIEDHIGKLPGYRA